MRMYMLAHAHANLLRKALFSIGPYFVPFSTIQSTGYRCLAEALVVPRALRDRYTQVIKVFAILYGSGAVLIHE